MRADVWWVYSFLVNRLFLYSSGSMKVFFLIMFDIGIKLGILHIFISRLLSLYQPAHRGEEIIKYARKHSNVFPLPRFFFSHSRKPNLINGIRWKNKIKIEKCYLKKYLQENHIKHDPRWRLWDKQLNASIIEGKHQCLNDLFAADLAYCVVYMRLPFTLQVGR